MNTYYNTYTYNLFKMLLSLNLTKDISLEISDEDLMIMEAVHKDLIFKDLISFNQFVKIVKKLSVEFLRTPISITMIIHDEIKNKETDGN